MVQIEGGPKERGVCNEERSDRGVHQRLFQTSPCSLSVSSRRYPRCLIQGTLEATWTREETSPTSSWLGLPLHSTASAGSTSMAAYIVHHQPNTQQQMSRWRTKCDSWQRSGRLELSAAGVWLTRNGHGQRDSHWWWRLQCYPAVDICGWVYNPGYLDLR